MEEIVKRLKEESLKITGKEFESWYEGLSPIEKVAYGKSVSK